jgi:DNA polymerase-3 subunit delta'
MSIIGHQQLIQFFDNAIESDKLAQAYCLAGCEQVGKRAVARYLSAKLLKVSEKQLETHPDFFYLSREENEKTGKMKKEISIAQARLLKDKVGNKSWLGGKKIAVIDEAELLNKESANALLKVLEETGGNTIFFLLTTDDSALLPTIKSRCQLFYLSLVSETEILAGLKELGFDGKTAIEVVSLAQGRPGRALSFARDENLREEYAVEMRRWDKMIGEPFYKRLEIAEDLLKEKEDMDNKEKLPKILEAWIILWRDVMLAKTLEKKSENFIVNCVEEKSLANQSEILSFIDLLKKTQVMVKQNVNAKLLVEEILLQAK